MTDEACQRLPRAVLTPCLFKAQAIASSAGALATALWLSMHSKSAQQRATSMIAIFSAPLTTLAS
jgi:hypothetical protein